MSRVNGGEGDDRLPAAIRRSERPARVVEVQRGENSKVHLGAIEPVRRHLDDATAITKAEHLSSDEIAEVVPDVLRVAGETAAKERYFARRLAQGHDWPSTGEAWDALGGGHRGVRAALSMDADAFRRWLDGARRKTALGVVTSGAHDTLRSNPDAALTAVRQFIRDIRSSR